MSVATIIRRRIGVRSPAGGLFFFFFFFRFYPSQVFCLRELLGNYPPRENLEQVFTVRQFSSGRTSPLSGFLSPRDGSPSTPQGKTWAEVFSSGPASPNSGRATFPNRARVPSKRRRNCPYAAHRISSSQRSSLSMKPPSRKESREQKIARHRIPHHATRQNRRGWRLY